MEAYIQVTYSSLLDIYYYDVSYLYIFNNIYKSPFFSSSSFEMICVSLIC